MSDLVIPKPRLLIPFTDFFPGKLSQYSRERVYWAANKFSWRQNDIRRSLGLPVLEVPEADKVVPALAPIAGGAASFSDWLELKVLDYIFNDPSTAFVSSDPYLGLWTVTTTLDDTSTGSATNECTYTTYARAAIPNASMSAASAGSKTNGTAISFTGYVSGSTTATQWMIATAATAGNSLVWGTCTSTTIDSTHNPATVAIGALTVTLD